jgi:hypothetical protein
MRFDFATVKTLNRSTRYALVAGLFARSSFVARRLRTFLVHDT